MLTKNIKSALNKKMALVRVAQASFHSSKPMNEVVSF